MISVKEKPLEIPISGNILIPPREPNNMHNFPAKITPPDQEIHEDYEHIFDQLATQGK